MANPLRICYLNVADQANITTGAAAIGSLPVANLLDDDIQKLWRSSDPTGDAIIIDLTAQKAIGVFALINTNLVTTSLIHVRVSSDDPTGQNGNVHDSTQFASDVDPVFAKFVYFSPTDVTGRYIRIGSPHGNWEGGRIVIGPTWAPSRDMQPGFERLWRDFSTKTRSLGGNEFVDVKPRQRGYRFSLKGLTEAEAEDQVEQLNMLRGIGRDILVCRNKDSSNLGRDTIWGLLEEPARMRKDLSDFYVVEFEVWDRN